jgi:hypothetical protein
MVMAALRSPAGGFKTQQVNHAEVFAMVRNGKRR